ncbi:MAG: alpha-1,3-fucosyltransferase [bacterium]|nr:alpha-1,3-fucosyltransferase [bacterium]
MKRFFLPVWLSYDESKIVLRRFLRNTLRGCLFPRLYYPKKDFVFQEGDVFTYPGSLPASLDSKTVILLFNSMFGIPLALDEVTLPENCEITTDRRHMADAAAVVFHLPTLGIIRYLKKPPGQLWVAWTMECEAHYPRWQKSAFLKRFDLKISYHQDADVVTTYVHPKHEELLRTPLQEKKPGNLVAFFASNYDERSGRTRYVAELMKYLDVHCYGKCLRNRRLPKEQDNRPGKWNTLASYKFDLAFENAIARDYVTEKFFDPLVAGSVPVYLGAPNIKEYMPGKHCFINVSDFSRPKELAEYLLKLDKNDAEYQQYLAWKRQPYKPSFLTMLERGKEHPFVQLCQKIQTIRTEIMGCIKIS